MRFLLLLLLLCGLSFSPAFAQDQDTGQVVQQPAGTIIVPDQFLRRWDPVTIFFDHNMGAQPGSPEDTPGRLITAVGA